MWRSRMFWRLFGAYGLLLVTAILIIGMVIDDHVEHYAEHQLELNLRNVAFLTEHAVRSHKSSEGPLSHAWIEAWRGDLTARISLLAADGHVMADSEAEFPQAENPGATPEVHQAMTDGFGSAIRPSDSPGRSTMYVAVRAADPADHVAVVRIGMPVDSIQPQLSGMRRVIWTGAILAVIGALVLTYWLVRRIIQPLENIKESAEKIAGGAYGNSVYASSRDELGELARSFNRMSTSLAAQFAQLDEDRQQLRAILSGMVEGVIALDADQRILFANERAAQLLEFQSQAAIGRKIWEVFRQRSLQDVVRRALAAPEPCQEEVTWNGATARHLTVHAARLSDPPARGAVLVLHDTSELRRLERLRHDFVANVSHELKTPLSVIKACVETLLDGAIDDADHREPFLEQITEQADRLHALILDLLSLARIESGTEAFDYQAVALEPAADACLEHHRARAEARGQKLELVPGETTLPVVAWADEEALEQILENLVDNAVKYTPRGGVIRLRCWAENGAACFDVADTGIGIAERDLQRIFERFYRVDKARSRELGGTGLGLSIVKHLVQAMGGSVRATSRLGKGSTFTVWLPSAPAS